MTDDDGDLIARHIEPVMSRLKSLYEGSRNDPDRFSRRGGYSIDMTETPALTRPLVLHDEDYCVFRHFSDDTETIIDIGANSGYSAESIWASGCGAQVLSFEALELHEQNLAALKDAYGDRFDYRIIGMGSSSAVLEFVAPVVNGVILTAMATAWNDIHWPSLAENTIRFGDIDAFRSNRPVEVDLEFNRAPVMTLDEALCSQDVNLQSMNVCAIKIDVEGLEPEVVAGAQETLLRHKPLLLVEAARHRTGMLQMLQEMGYRIARRTGDVLEYEQEPPATVNTFFWHADQQRHYESIGLLAQKRSTSQRFLQNWLKRVLDR